MKKQVSVSCPMDCTDLCRFIVTVENNRVIKLEGDRHHPVTKGFVCSKGRALVDRLYHPRRIRHPLIRETKGFRQATYAEVFDRVCEKLTTIRQTHGSQAILNYTSDGYGGIKSRIQSIFFNCFGGVTQPRGSLCWGAGIAAQQYDFGHAKGHFPDDVLNADTILVWGRNPKFTSIHLYALLKQARKNKSRIVVIDPVKTATANAFDHYVRIHPSTDGALALAMANTIIENKLHNNRYIENHVLGFNRFKAYAAGFTLERAEKITGISARVIQKLAMDYARSDAASIYIGFGIQRYQNGGNAVRCIDALAAITGKVGKPGCGVNYAARSISPYLCSLDKQSQEYALHKRLFTVGNLGNFLEKDQSSTIKAVFVSCANPLTQSPDLEKTIKQFSRIGFKVVFDHFMTDTAQRADIVLPAAFVFEQDDLFATSMYSPVANLSQKAVDPPEGVMPEFEFYLELARKMDMENLGFTDSQDYLKKSAQPLLDKCGLRFENLSNAYVRIEKDDIAWADNQFETPSGKIELYSETAKQDGLCPHPAFEEPLCGSTAFPLRLLTCHARESMHSQGFAFTDALPRVYVNLAMARKFGVQTHTHVWVKGEKAKLKVELCVDDAICDDVAFMYQGWWYKSGAVNFLTTARISDMGLQAAFYDSFCTIEKIKA